MQPPEKIIISRIDSIGDVVLTLPVCGVLKKHFPNTKIVFLGNTYTLPILEYCKHIDEPLDYWVLRKADEREQVQKIKSLQADCAIHVFPNKKLSGLFKKAKIPIRIGTNRRLYNWFNCNKLINLTRKNSNLHEAQLNLKLLSGLGLNVNLTLSQIPDYYGLMAPEATQGVRSLLDNKRKTIVLHPKSKGSAREWGLHNFANLIELLPEHLFNILIAGTEQEGEMFRKELVFPYKDKVTDISGKLSLTEYISLISNSYALIAASTGPLHIAAALGIKAIGIYAPMRPIFPTRWAPLGKKAVFLVKESNCNDCKQSRSCHCIQEISVHDVLKLLQNDE